MRWNMLCCTSLCSVLYQTAMYCPVLRCTALRCTTLSCQVWPEVMAVLAEGEMLAQPWQQDPADADVAPLSLGWKVVGGAYAGYELVRQVIQVCWELIPFPKLQWSCPQQDGWHAR